MFFPALVRLHRARSSGEFRGIPDFAAAFVVLSALFGEVLSALDIRFSMFRHTLFLVALGVGQVVPFLLHRAKVYEVGSHARSCA